MHVQGLSWRRLGADEMGGEQVSARRQKTSEEGQDMRNPWHQNSVKGKSQTYVVCVCVCSLSRNAPSATRVVGSCRSTRGVFGCYRTLGYVIVNLIFYFECTSLARSPPLTGGRWPKDVSPWISTPLHHQSRTRWSNLQQEALKNRRLLTASSVVSDTERHHDIMGYWCPHCSIIIGARLVFRFPIGEVVNLLKWLMCFGAQFVHAALFLASNQ